MREFRHVAWATPNAGGTPGAGEDNRLPPQDALRCLAVVGRAPPPRPARGIGGGEAGSVQLGAPLQ